VVNLSFNRFSRTCRYHRKGIEDRCYCTNQNNRARGSMCNKYNCPLKSEFDYHIQ